MIVFNRTRGETVASKVEKAEDFLSRSRGLLGRKTMEPGSGLWIAPCPMIHTWFMQFPIDAVFLNRELKVVRVLENLKPWRMSPWILSAHSVLELAAGAAAGKVTAGDFLQIS